MKKIHFRAAAGLLAVALFSIAMRQSFAQEMKLVSSEEKKVEAALTGRVLHTEHWEENRNSANHWYERHSQSEKKRSEDTFWSGEKFVLEAEAVGENLPRTIKAFIPDTDFETVLHKSGDIYRGELFHKEMMFLWGNRAPEPVTILFEAEIDGSVCRSQQQVILDNRELYWLLHRKE